MVLYRKFRPDNFTDIKEQTVITQVLRTAITQKRIAHAYLFTGTRGIGKTTMARVFAKAINCTNPQDGNPCNTCESCVAFNRGTNVDLIEIDAASNRGIDDIREIKEKVNFAPTMSQYKVYIIDEVHMLTKDAFNALLKTLEEPPSFVVFILATTEVYKVPLTIVSRCQRFDFKNASMQQLKELLTEVSKEEGISIEDGAIDLISECAEGSFRDGLSILQKVASLDELITYNKVLEMLGLPDQQMLQSIIAAIVAGKGEEALDLFKQSLQTGLDPYQFNKNILKILEKKLITLSQKEKIPSDLSIQSVLALIKEFLTAEERLKYAAVPSLIVENAIVTASLSHTGISQSPSQESKKEEPIKRVAYDIPITIPKAASSSGKEHIRQKETDKEIPKEKTEKQSLENTESMKAISTGKNVSLDMICELWPSLVGKIMPENHHLGSFLSSAQPVAIEEGMIHLQVKYAFHKDRIEDIKSRELFALLCEQLFGTAFRPICEVNAKMKKVVFEKKPQIGDNSDTPQEEDILKEAMKIFEIE